MTQRIFLGLCLLCGLCCWAALKSFPPQRGAEPLRLRTASAQGTSSQLGETSQEEVNRLRQELETLQASLIQSHQEAQQATIAAAEARQRLQSIEEELKQQQTAFQEAQQTCATQTEALVRLQQRQGGQQQAQGGARRHALEEAMRARLAEEMQRQMVTVSQGPDYVSLQVASDALFFRSGVVLHTEAQTFLNKLATMLQDIADHPVRIEGHTDNVPIRKTRRKQWPTNWELSTARAAAVARALMRQGLAAQRVTIGGYGDSRPIAANETPIGRTHNRRLDVIVRVPAEL